MTDAGGVAAGALVVAGGFDPVGERTAVEVAGAVTGEPSVAEPDAAGRAVVDFVVPFLALPGGVLAAELLLGGLPEKLSGSSVERINKTTG